MNKRSGSRITGTAACAVFGSFTMAQWHDDTEGNARGDARGTHGKRRRFIIRA